MNRTFKEKLIDMYDRDAGQFGRSISEEELKKIIRYGVMGELGDNYFLFLYRDFYRDTPYYGAVIILNKRAEPDRPVTIIGVEQDGSEKVRNAFVKAAFFFLKNENRDTMTVSGNAAAVFNMAKDKINNYIGKTRTFAGSDALEHVDFDIVNQTVQYREIEIKKNTRKFESPGLKNNLQKLEDDNELIQQKKIEIEQEGDKRLKAGIGLVLKWKRFDLTGKRYGFFQPVIVPIKENGLYGNPRKIENLNLSAYEFPGVPRTLEDFLKHFAAIDNLPGSPKLKAMMMNRVFFRDLAAELLQLPEELSFCQWDDRKDYHSLKKSRFQKVTARFAPSLEKTSAFRFLLDFTPGNGQVLNAGVHYEILLDEQQVYVSFTCDDGENWFAVPEEPAHVYRFFAFLEAQGEFYLDDLEKISTALQRIQSDYLLIHAEPLKKYELNFMPTPVLNLYPADGRTGKDQRLELEFDYRQEMKKFTAEHPDKQVFTYKRNREFENRCLEVIKNDPLLSQQIDYHKTKGKVYHYYDFQDNDSLKWLVERGSKYLEKGFKIYSTKLKRYIGHTGSSIWMNVSMGRGSRWLEFKPVIHDPVTGEDHEINLDDPDLFASFDHMIVDKTGMLHLVTPAEIEKLAQLYRYAERNAGIFRVPTRNHILVRSLYDKRMDRIPELREILSTGERMKAFDSIPLYPLSKNFNGQLRGYQQEGFKWLYFLRDYGFSGCLADDMGLGKTIQTLALLQTLKDDKKLKTSLLVVPVSAVPNWEAETGRFTPGLTYYCHIGPSRDKDTGAWGEKDLIITSYATLRNDIEIFTGYGFDYIILDESQNIKNITSQISRAVKVLSGKNRLALSGTPIENNTMELWSLFDFLIPGFLGTFQWFNRQFAQAIERDKDETKAELLKQMIYPFVMRRKKQDVESQLPEKTEIVSMLRMEADQLKLYAAIARDYREELEKEIDEKGVGGSSMRILAGMVRLRQICLFPRLVDEAYNKISSAKFNHLRGLLEDILAEDHKVLIFSQFVQVLKILRGYCDDEHIKYAYIDGSVKLKTREEMIRQFQEDEGTRVFLLSLKAGGVSLNLTAADYVIIFDPWWNPAVEAQAIDRTHRIGQTRKVMAYRMVVADTIEQGMLELQERKKALVEDLIASDSQSFKDLKKEDILNLFNF
jgi:superfamily II DNA or RNA helicase